MSEKGTTRSGATKVSEGRPPDPTSTDAANATSRVVPPATFETLEHPIGQDHTVEAKAVDHGRGVVLERPTLETELIRVKKTPDPEKIANLKFMEEEVTIYIQDTNVPHADQRFGITVNGREIVFLVGRQYTVSRKYVETLARGKQTHYGNEEYTEDGIHGVRWPARSGLRYPFSVVEDKNPVGHLWLKSVLAQP